MFPALRKTLEHSTTSRALNFFGVLETTLLCSKTVLSTPSHCLLPYQKSFFCCSAKLEKLFKLASDLKTNLKFSIIKTYGPVHQMGYTMKCTFGEIETTVDGIGKKNTRKMAALSMYEKVKDSVNARKDDIIKGATRKRRIHEGQESGSGRSKKNFIQRTIDPRNAVLRISGNDGNSDEKVRIILSEVIVTFTNLDPLSI